MLSDLATEGLAKAHDYQHDGIRGILGRWNQGDRSTLLVMATGTGKTYVFGLVGAWAREEHGKPILCIAHRSTLIDQASNQLAEFGLDVGIEQGKQTVKSGMFGEPDAVVATVQTLKGKRLQEWPRDHFGLIIIDEVHHAISGGYRAIIDWFSEAKVLGVTATPDRLDGEDLGQVFQSVAYEYDLFTAIKAGRLKRIRVARCRAGVDLRKIRTTNKKDLSVRDLERAITPYVGKLANAARKEIGGRRSILFAPDVGSAIAFSSAFTAIGISAGFVHGGMENPNEVYDDFRSGRIQVLCNCEMATEGVDFPFVSAIILSRPTKSRALMCQMIGRGTRLFPGSPDCLVVDFAWLTGTHKLVKLTELFYTASGPRFHDEVNADADAWIEAMRGRHPDLLAVIEQADIDKVERDKQKLTLNIDAKRRDVRYKRAEYDIVNAWDLMDVRESTMNAGDGFEGDRATDGQIVLLRRLGFDEGRRLSRRRAGALIGALAARSKLKLARPKQVNALIAAGCDPEWAKRISFKEASAELDKVFAARRA